MSPHAVDQINTVRGAAAPELPAFSGKYLSVTTFRRNGSPVATPVWFVRDFDRLLVETDGGSGKVRRLRRDPRALIAPCRAMGRITGPEVEATVAVLPDQERPRAERLIKRKYRRDMLFIRPIRAIQSMFRRGGAPQPVVLSITLAPPELAPPELAPPERVAEVDRHAEPIAA